MNYAFFVGAGASASCGAPTQNRLFNDFFIGRNSPNSCSDERERERELATFFLQIYGLDVDKPNLNTLSFPTFEETLGIIDIAIMKNESIRSFETSNVNYNSSNRLIECREHIVSLMASVLYDKLSNVENNHKKLIKCLEELDQLKNSIFISTNYDILLDNAISSSGNKIDYGFSYQDDSCYKDSMINIPLFKLHGSLNWLFCPACNKITVAKNEKIVMNMVRPITYGNHEENLCSRCGCTKNFIIVPPTYNKNYSNFYLTSSWFNAEEKLRNVDIIFFLGYSFPDADIHVKYLLKKVETSITKPLKVVVCNNHNDKEDVEKLKEEARFNRFFINNVDYTNIGFEDFILDIRQYIHD